MTTTASLFTGPPTADQQKARDNPVDLEASRDLVTIQEELQKLRKITIGSKPGGGVVYLPNGQTTRKSDPVNFDPAAPPSDDLLTLPGNPPAHQWKVIKAAYDKGVNAIQHIVSLHPQLFLVLRGGLGQGNYEDTSKTSKVASDTSQGRQTTRDMIAHEMADTLKNITSTRALMGKVLAKELVPIHDQLRGGTTTSPARPSRNWGSDPCGKPRQTHTSSTINRHPGGRHSA